MQSSMQIAHGKVRTSTSVVSLTIFFQACLSVLAPQSKQTVGVDPSCVTVSVPHVEHLKPCTRTTDIFRRIVLIVLAIFSSFVEWLGRKNLRFSRGNISGSHRANGFVGVPTSQVGGDHRRPALDPYLDHSDCEIRSPRGFRTYGLFCGHGSSGKPSHPRRRHPA